jgi:hypothetical protein
MDWVRKFHSVVCVVSSSDKRHAQILANGMEQTCHTHCHSMTRMYDYIDTTKKYICTSLGELSPGVIKISCCGFASEVDSKCLHACKSELLEEKESCSPYFTVRGRQEYVLRVSLKSNDPKMTRWNQVDSKMYYILL